jgi:DtxR family Mn-dependent transcriptional regulator
VPSSPTTNISSKGLDRKHDTIKHFFIDVLGVDEALADKDACEIEHVISDKTLDKLVEYLESMQN